MPRRSNSQVQGQFFVNEIRASLCVRISVRTRVARKLVSASRVAVSTVTYPGCLNSTRQDFQKPPSMNRPPNSSANGRQTSLLRPNKLRRKPMWIMSGNLMGWAQGRFLTNDSLLNATQADPVVSKLYRRQSSLAIRFLQEKTFTISVNLPDLFLNRELVRRGLAWHYKEYSDDKRLAADEDNARLQKLGLWGGSHKPIARWDWRKMSKVERDEYR
ncbi:MAG TPA: hypothetical protein EYG03_20235 [Planctomycetes bacterium]|nr:hypothetical protein [Planctomycetota bacterium]